MRRLLGPLVLLLSCGVLSSAQTQSARTFDAYVIDVEGGEATLFVSPSGESLLVDTGWPGFDGRDADRILAAAKDAGIKQIDYLVITHYHADHAGGTAALAARLPIRHFVDHGSNVGEDERTQYQSYAAVRGKRTLDRSQTRRHDSNGRSQCAGHCCRRCGPAHAAHGAGRCQSLLRRLQTAWTRDHEPGSGRRRQPFGESVRDLRQVQNDHHGGPDLEQGVRADVPGEPAGQMSTCISCPTMARTRQGRQRSSMRCGRARRS